MHFERVLVCLSTLVLLAAPAFGDAILGPNDLIIAIDADGIVSNSSYPAAEGPGNLLDGDPATKYLNFGEQNSGFIVTPEIGPSVLDSFQITTANDHPDRDPVVWMIYGTNDEIATVNNGDGLAESWTLICGGTMALPEERFAVGPVYTIANQAEAYASYKVVFETVKDAAAANSMQIAEIQFYGAPVGPEPEEASAQ